MAYGETCENCRYGEFKPDYEKHIGAKEYDVWCTYYKKWVGCGDRGGCDKYE